MEKKDPQCLLSALWNDEPPILGNFVVEPKQGQYDFIEVYPYRIH